MNYLSSWGAWGAQKFNDAYNAFAHPYATGDDEDLKELVQASNQDESDGELPIGPFDVSRSDDEPKLQEGEEQPAPVIADYDENPADDPLANWYGDYKQEDLEHLANNSPVQNPFENLKAKIINTAVGAEVEYVSPVTNEQGLGGAILNLAADNPIGNYFVKNYDKVRERTAWALIGTTDFDKIAAEQKAALTAVVGHPRLGILMEAFIPRATDIVIKTISKNYPGFNTFLITEKPRIEKIIRSAFFKVAVNFAKDTKLNLTKFDLAGTDLTNEMIKKLISISNRQMRETANEGKFDEIDTIGIPGIRKVELRKLFESSVNEFLAIALPNGSRDLGLRSVLGDSIFDAISKFMLPDIFIDIYRLEHKQPFHTEKDLEILEQKGGAVLKHIAEVVGQEISEFLPKMLAKKAHKLAEKGLMEADMQNLLWLKTWLGDRVVEFAESEDPNIKAIWGFVKKNIESVMIHALASLADTEDKPADANLVAVVAGEGLKVLDDFITANKDAIDAVDAKPLTETYTAKDRKEERENLFKPLVDTIIKKSRLENKNKVELVDSEKLARKMLPVVLSKLYEDMKVYPEDLSKEKNRLADVLFDPNAYFNRLLNDDPAAAVQQLVLENRAGNQAVLQNAEITQTVEELATACGILAEDVAKIAKAYAKKDEKQIAHMINKGLFKNNRLNPQEEKDFADGLHQIMNSENPSIEKIWEYSEKIIQTAIFKVFVRVAENTPVEADADRKVNKNMALPGNVVHRALSFLANRMPNIDEEIERIRGSDMSKAEKKKQIAMLFRPLAADFLDLAGENLKEILPVPKMFRSFLAKKLRNEYLPEIFGKMYKDLNGWRYDAHNQEDKLDVLFPNGSGKKAATSIANYIKDFVPYYLETNPEKVTEILEKQAMGKYFAALSEEHQNSLRGLIQRNVHALGVNPDMQVVAKGIGEFSRGIILKMFSGITQSVDAKDKTGNGTGTNKFLFNTTLGFIRVLGDHVRRINKIPPAGRMYPAHNVPHSAMLNGFANHPSLPNMLHPALEKDLDPNATPEQRKEQRLKEFFVPFAADLLSIAGITDPKDFPAPSFMKEEAWDMFKTKMLPEILLNMYEEMLKPENINMMLLKTVDGLIEEIDKLPDEVKNDEPVEMDPQQRELNKALGDVVKEMIVLMPDIWTKTIFASDRIRNMTSEALGAIIRRKLDSTTMIEMMNKALTNLKFNKPDENRGKTDLELDAEKARVEKELNKKMTSYISHQVKEALQNMIKTKWDGFQAKFDKGVQKAFGKPGLAVKRFFDVIFRFIFITVLGTVFNFILYKCIWFFVDKKIAKKSDEIIKDLQMPINENAMLNFTQVWLDGMKGVEAAQHQDEMLLREAKQLRRQRKIEEEQVELHQDAVKSVIDENLETAAVEEKLVENDEINANDEEANNLNELIEQARLAANAQQKS
jgi:hypothetical protein